eukprot:UN25188
MDFSYLRNIHMSNCSGSHRRLGVHISFVRSSTLDKWSRPHFKRMMLSGNANANDFFRKHGWRGSSNRVDILKKYTSKAANLYKAHLDRAIQTYTLPNTSTISPKAQKVPEKLDDIFAQMLVNGSDTKTNGKHNSIKPVPMKQGKSWPSALKPVSNMEHKKRATLRNKRMIRKQ